MSVGDPCPTRRHGPPRQVVGPVSQAPCRVRSVAWHGAAVLGHVTLLRPGPGGTGHCEQVAPGPFPWIIGQRGRRGSEGLGHTVPRISHAFVSRSVAALRPREPYICRRCTCRVCWGLAGPPVWGPFSLSLVVLGVRSSVTPKHLSLKYSFRAEAEAPLSPDVQRLRDTLHRAPLARPGERVALHPTPRQGTDREAPPPCSAVCREPPCARGKSGAFTWLVLTPSARERP